MIWQKLTKIANNFKTKTIFSIKTIFSNKRAIVRWTLGINVAALVIGLANRQDLQPIMCKQTQIISEITIPKYFRVPAFKLFSRYYQVNQNQVQLPFNQYCNFSQFFSRKINRILPAEVPNSIGSPCDAKILTIGEVTSDQCQIIKNASYSLTELILDQKTLPNSESIVNFIKKKQSNKIYQIILYLGPGDYHRFHAPTGINILKRKYIPGLCQMVNQKKLATGKQIYQKNGRVSVFSEWSQGLLTMVMVGALNVTKIHLNEENKLNFGDELGYFRLGSTIVMLFEAKGIKEWKVKAGDRVQVGQSLLEVVV